MKRLKKAWLPAYIAAALGVIGFASTTPALASTYTVNLTMPASTTVGSPVLIEAWGVQPPPSEYWNMAWLEVVAIPRTIASNCPASDQDAAGVAVDGGGKIIAIALRPNLDEDGNFSNTLAYTPFAPGQMLICGYADDGAGLTLARTGVLFNVEPAPAGGALPPTPTPTPPQQAAAAKPANVKQPRVTRSAKKLVCDPGQWSNGSGGYSYKWLVAGKPKSGATAQKLRITRALHRRKVQCSVTASNGSGSATAMSRPFKVR
jgi:hypothetical protein